MRLRNRQRGLSLIELMIGILLSSILLLGVLQIFQSSRMTMETEMALSGVQDSGRFAMDYLSRETRMADYWGCAPDQGSIANHLDTTARSAFQSSIGAHGVQGVDGAGAAEKVGGVDVVDGTDILILGGAEDACAGTGRLLDTAGTSLQVTDSCAVEAGQVVLVANCDGGDVITITGVIGGGGSPKSLSHASGVVNPSWVPNSSGTLSQEYDSESALLRPYQRTFFLSPGVSGTSSLFVYEEGSAAPRELVQGIDDMQIHYGRDTNEDEVVDVWQNAVADLGQMSSVVAVRVQLVAASDNAAAVGEQKLPDLDGDGAESTYTDDRLRKLYTTTIKVRNRGGM